MSEEELKKTNSNTNQSDNSIICQSCGKPKKSEFQICPYCQNKEEEKLVIKDSRYKSAKSSTIKTIVCLIIFICILFFIMVENAFINYVGSGFAFGWILFSALMLIIFLAIFISIIRTLILWIRYFNYIENALISSILLIVLVGFIIIFFHFSFFFLTDCNLFKSFFD